MNNSKLKKNIIAGFLGQLIITILGIIVPRIMLTSYGSDVNGLLCTVTQIFTYMALLEAGIGQAARNALYKPIIEGKKEDISYVMSMAQTYYRKITCFYGLGVILLSIVMPMVLKSDVNNSTIFFVVFFEGLAGVLSFLGVETPVTMLIADGRGYVNTIIDVMTRIFIYIFKIVLALLGCSIVYLQLGCLFITIVKVFVYQWYFKKHYSWIDFKKAPSKARLNDRNSYIITEIAWTIFSSTDMIVLSIFVSTKLSSVYAIYNLIFSNLNILLNAIYNNVNYVLGQTYHENLKKYEKVHDAFMSIFLGTMTILMSVAYLLCIPFVQLYTRGITDINYIYDVLPLLFCLIQILSWSRYVGGNLTGVAGYAKETSRISLIEAMLNIMLSIILVNQFGIVGVLVATVVALPLKIIWCIYISDKKVMCRSYKKTFSILGINYLFFTAVVFVRKIFDWNININEYVSFMIYGVVITIVCSIIGIGLNFLVNPESLQLVKKLLGREKNERGKLV